MLNVPFSSLLTSNEDVKKAIIFSHNEARRNAKPSASNMLEMVWDDDAAKKAEGYAKMCIAGHSPPSYRKISDINCGENVFLSSFKAAWEDVLQSFLSEAVDFDYGKGPKSPSLEIRHYTQMMWASSNRVGCGVAECSNNVFKYDYVCIYCPGGNDGDSIGFPYKSGPACEDCKSSCDKGLCTNPCPHQDKYADCKDYYHGQKCDASLEEDCPATFFSYDAVEMESILGSIMSSSHHLIRILTTMTRTKHEIIKLEQEIKQLEDSLCLAATKEEIASVILIVDTHINSVQKDVKAHKCKKFQRDFDNNFKGWVYT
ncbi:cysteine-rich venom protein pseudechetoxin-like [Pelobates fuscus]|uniref:cysteine-rich venom protein pseudechetoxin-like n=1 Tax=Pelobates fuscus TaxID=191477 RepID=UPI002FE42CFF